MKVYNIKDMLNGWFIGDFTPSILKTKNFEIAHHFYPAGYKSIKHYHKIAEELNYIISGKLTASGQLFHSGDFFAYEPNEISDVVFLEDTNLIIVKWPSCPDDKYLL